MKKLATLLLITISLSVNAVEPGDIDPNWFDEEGNWIYAGGAGPGQWFDKYGNLDINTHGGPEGHKDTLMETDVNIEGGFGIRLGATYNHDFLKPSYDMGIDGNMILPSKPLDIFSKYQLFVDDKKVAWAVRAQGEITESTKCYTDSSLLEKAIVKKYKYADKIFRVNEWDFSPRFVNIAQNRSISLNCKEVYLKQYGKRYHRLTIIYFDKGIRDKYKNEYLINEADSRIKIDNQRINSYSGSI